MTKEKYKQILTESRHDLYKFYRMIVCSNFKENLPAEHIKQISGELMTMMRDDYQRLCVSLPPRHSKSSLITIAYPLFLIFNNPSLNIVIVNNTSTLSEKFGIAIREYVKNYGHNFNVYLSNIKHSTSHLMFCNEEGHLYTGNIRLVGAGGSITGHDADYIIIDDPYKGLAEEFTPTALQKTIDWFNTIILQRLEPQSKLIILHTRWHSNDIIGHLQNLFPDEYRFFSYPAIQNDGKPLWPDRYTTAMLEQKREEMGDRLFESIYQQKPLDDSTDFFDLDKIHWKAPEEYKVKRCVRGYDIAGSSNTSSDYTAGVPVYLLEDNTILITDYLYGQFGGETWNKVKQTVHQDGADVITVIETGVAAAGKLLFKEWRKQLNGFIVKRAMALPNKSKSDRATPLKNKIFDGEVFIDIKDNKLRDSFIREFKAFPDGVHDDIVDATAHAYNYIVEHYITEFEWGIIDL